jgi:hemoglobin
VKEIESKTDIEKMLVAFYEKAFSDDLIGDFFTRVVPLDLETHIPVIALFWESVVLNGNGYRKNVMEVHQHIHHLKHIKKEHLDRWLSLFKATVDEFFVGEKANLMKQRAVSIATLMDIKLNHPQTGRL